MLSSGSFAYTYMLSMTSSLRSRFSTSFGNGHSFLCCELCTHGPLPSDWALVVFVTFATFRHAFVPVPRARDDLLYIGNEFPRIQFLIKQIHIWFMWNLFSVICQRPDTAHSAGLIHMIKMCNNQYLVKSWFWVKLTICQNMCWTVKRDIQHTRNMRIMAIFHAITSASNESKKLHTIFYTVDTGRNLALTLCLQCRFAVVTIFIPFKICSKSMQRLL